MTEIIWPWLTIVGLFFDLIGFVIVAAEVMIVQKLDFQRAELIKKEECFQKDSEKIRNRHINEKFKDEISYLDYTINYLGLADKHDSQEFFDAKRNLAEIWATRQIDSAENDKERKQLDVKHQPKIFELKRKINRLSQEWLPLRRALLLIGTALIVVGFTLQIIASWVLE